jgi:CRISPR-associated protein Csm2
MFTCIERRMRDMILNEKDYVDKAEKVMKSIKERNHGRFPFTTTKIRGLLAMTMDIYNEVLPLREDELPEDVKGKINYLKVHFLYEAGRNFKDVKPFVEEAQLIKCLEEVQGSKKRYEIFSRYMEALVAYFKYYGGRD